MSMVRSFSISWKRNRFELKLFCLAPSGKEHITKVFLDPPSMEHMATKMLKAVEEQRESKSISKTDDERPRYIG